MSELMSIRQIVEEMTEWPVCIVIPMEPRTVNHYVKHTRAGRHYKTAKAKAFERTGAMFVRGQSIEAKKYSVRIDLFLAKGSRGDIDNFLKQPLDLLKNEGVIHSDAAIRDLRILLDRDWNNPRIEIRVKAL